LRSELLKKIEKRIIVSCQALEDEPLHGRGIMVLMARAAIMGGAAAIRANGTQDIEDIKAAFDIPVIGLIKQNMEGYPVYITPTSQDALSVLRAGADVVAIDCTLRRRPEPLDSIFAAKVLLANLLEIGKGGHALGRLPGNIKPQLPNLSLSGPGPCLLGH